jgi:hypothetical protein
MENHYKWLETNFSNFAFNLGIKEDRVKGLIVAHGDKCESYKSRWDKVSIPFPHGVAIYLISHISPYEKEVRQTDKGWVDVCKWIIDNYDRFKPYLPGIKE